MTRALRRRLGAALPVKPRLVSRSVSLGSVRVARSAGTRPASNPATAATSATKRNMCQSKGWLVRSAASPGRRMVSIHFMRPTPMAAPPIAPNVDNKKLSVSNCRNRRRRLAPRAERTAISRARMEARESSRLVTLTQVTISTRPTSPRNTAAINGHALADEASGRASFSGITSICRPASVSG